MLDITAPTHRPLRNRLCALPGTTVLLALSVLLRVPQVVFLHLPGIPIFPHVSPVQQGISVPVLACRLLLGCATVGSSAHLDLRPRTRVFARLETHVRLVLVHRNPASAALISRPQVSLCVCLVLLNIIVTLRKHVPAREFLFLGGALRDITVPDLLAVLRRMHALLAHFRTRLVFHQLASAPIALRDPIAAHLV